ncbi:MAG: agmatine deiminase family protein [Pirellulaceae bacterium]|nr:agmatine deiminase family protein [Pirellulaceae bacterium]
MQTSSPHYWPAEWEQQSAIWLSWPHNANTWLGHFDFIPPLYVQWIRQLSALQPVKVLAGSESRMPEVQAALAGIDQVTIYPWKTNDVWIRDYGPTFVKRKSDGGLVGVDWHYNAWGGKYLPFDDDAAVAARICSHLACGRSRSALYCEGGGLETDGQGTLLTTSSCLLAMSRNPGWSRLMVEAELKRQLGVQEIIWVDGGGLQGDDTDGHIDQLARFVAPGVVVAATSSAPDDPNREGLEQNLEILRRSRTAQGQSLVVHPLPTPPPRMVGTQRVPESYCNFLLVNGALILPTFRSSSTDRQALKLFEGLVPNRQIIPTDAYDLIYGLGAFHCASQQQPL